MKEKILKFLKNNALYIFMGLVIVGLSLKLQQVINERNSLIIEEPVIIDDGSEGKYSEIYYSSNSFKEFKAKNEELYKEWKKYGNDIDYLINFSYEKAFSSDTVFISTNDNEDLNVYEYSEETDDSISYDLKIGSSIEPTWYLLNFRIKENFTLVNREENSLNKTLIETQNGGVLTDVDLHKRNNDSKNSIWKRFAVGPSVTAGYGTINHNFDIMVGVSCTFNLLK